MIPRAAKIALVAGIALFYSIVVFNNLTDPDSNYQFVRHVLMMDTTFPGNHGLWRQINSPAIHVAFCVTIIAWEVVTTVLLWWGVVRLLRAVDPGTHAVAADVAGGFSRGRRRVVPDVAVARVERPGSGIQEFRGGEPGAVDSVANGD
jgi:hypothetical protein